MAHLDDLLSFLGYDESPACIRPSSAEFRRAPRVGHILRKAAADLNLKAAYVLHPNPSSNSTRAPVPAVYVCSAKDEKTADALHRKIWNQDIAPFVLITSPRGIKLYSGFRHRENVNGNVEGRLSEFTSLDDASEALRSLDARSIDSGALWRDRQKEVFWKHRLNRRLLDNLSTVDQLLQADGLDQQVGHSLIGRYVYLRYLRDREILSPRKLERWGIAVEDVFGSNAKLGALAEVNKQLDAWLNGSVFPIKFGGKNAPKAHHVKLVSGIFEGDDVFGDGQVQLALDFKAYDFSHIPIETLSLVYEQFLHQGKSAEARAKGAYYTPIPVVNMMLSELEETHPLQRGMKVIDPSCGSGAFLVQAYRQLIEREFPPGSNPKPGELRELLERNIFGVDTDRDACNVTELSLILTLLDYLTPPDLEDRRRGFKLPTLRDQNIFKANFFDELPPTFEDRAKGGFGWVVGNPPWKQLNEKKLTKDDRPVWDWMKANAKDKPIGSNQSARAFVWKSGELLSKDGKAALFIPSMTLYDNPAEAFRKRFFTEYQVSAIADLSNLAEVISDGRFRVPGAGLFFEKIADDDSSDRDETITYYAPKVANQELTRPAKSGERVETWDLVINGSEIREVDAEKARSGDGLVWKTAMWGSHFDERLLRRIEKKFPSFAELESDGLLVASQGLELRNKGAGEAVEELLEIVGKKTFDPKALSGMRHLFSLPEKSFYNISNEKRFVRQGRGKLPLQISKPPHVIVSAARNFSIYSEEFIVVPARQIGVVSPTDDKPFLKALSLYLSSDFALYHQFFSATEFGIKRPRANLGTLREIPIPHESIRSNLPAWTSLHTRLRDAPPMQNGELDLFTWQKGESGEKLSSLLVELNKLVEDALGLSSQEKSLIKDLLHIRLGLSDGKVESCATTPPSKTDLKSYAQVLKRNLDGFLGADASHSHGVTVVPSETSGLVSIDFVKRPKKTSSKVESASSATAATLGKLSQQLLKARNQWVYFNRNFRVYDGNRTLVLKPMQRFHWTQTQAALDAQSIISETLTGSGE